MRTFVRIILGALLFVALLPVTAAAQTSAIAGPVRDASGAVLPGATVEAASPALLERVRAGVTNDSGQYKIATLRPGIYTITFTMPGFNVVKQENIELTKEAADQAKQAYHEANNVNVKIAKLTELVAGKEDKP